MRCIKAAVAVEWTAADRRGTRAFPYVFLYQLLVNGVLKENYQIDPNDHWMCAAAERNLPLFVPGWEDSTFGNRYAAKESGQEWGLGGTPAGLPPIVVVDHDRVAGLFGRIHPAARAAPAVCVDRGDVWETGSAFIVWLEQGREMRRLDRACVEAYREYLDYKFANPRTKNGYLTAVRQFLIFLARYHPDLVNPADFVQGGSCSRAHTRRHLLVEDAKALLAALESDLRKADLQRVRNVAMAYLMLKTGLRAIEVSRARVEHLQELVPGEKWRLWVHGKGRQSADELV